MISSLTSPPASMIFLACLPRSVPWLTCSRSMSPVARWQAQYFSLSRGACVPLPGEGERRRNRRSKRAARSERAQPQRDRGSTEHAPDPGGPMMIMRSCCEGVLDTPSVSLTASTAPPSFFSPAAEARQRERGPHVGRTGSLLGLLLERIDLLGQLDRVSASYACRRRTCATSDLR